MAKRSITIHGHSTSFSLEDEFWLALKTIAARHNISLARLVTKIDTKRAADINLSSALRLYVLQDLQEQVHKQS